MEQIGVLHPMSSILDQETVSLGMDHGMLPWVMMERLPQMSYSVQMRFIGIVFKESTSSPPPSLELALPLDLRF